MQNLKYIGKIIKSDLRVANRRKQQHPQVVKDMLKMINKNKNSEKVEFKPGEIFMSNCPTFRALFDFLVRVTPFRKEVF